MIFEGVKIESQMRFCDDMSVRVEFDQSDKKGEKLKN